MKKTFLIPVLLCIITSFVNSMDPSNLMSLFQKNDNYNKEAEDQKTNTTTLVSTNNQTIENDFNTLDKKLLVSVKTNDINSIINILKNEKYVSFLQREEYGETSLMQEALQKSSTETINILAQKFKFKASTSSGAFTWIFELGIDRNDEEIMKVILSNKELRKRWQRHDMEASLHAVTNNKENALKYIVQNFANQINHFDEALDIAKTHNYRGCLNWIMAYSALNPESELTNLSTFEKKCIQAYHEMLNGNSNDLRNLILPISQTRSKDTNSINYTFAVAPLQNVQTPAYKFIGNALFKTFKYDYIRPLLLSLPKFKWEQTAAIEMLKTLHLSNKCNNDFLDLEQTEENKVDNQTVVKKNNLPAKAKSFCDCVIQ